nr:type II CAAX endopeptidase family protein [Carnobacterium maltaromaticum]
MKLTESMLLTKSEQKRNVWLTIFFGIILMFVSQLIAILPAEIIKNQGASEVYTLFSNIIVIGAILLFCLLFEKRSLQSLGIQKKSSLLNIIKGWILGFSLLTVVFIINMTTNAIHISFDLKSISWIYLFTSLVGYLFQGTMEELFCRGFIMNSLSAKYNVWAGIIINTLIFTLLHTLSPGVTVLALINIFLAGLVLSFIFYLSDNLLLVGAFHASWNFMLGPIFGVPVSGLGFYSSVFNTTSLPEKTIINGGNFGFEGGLGLTIPVLVSLAIVFVILKKT